MKIALFIDQFPKISETFILNQVDGLLKDGHELTIFPCQHSGETQLHSIVKCHRLLEKTQFPDVREQTKLGAVCSTLRLMVLSMMRGQSIYRMRRTFGHYKGIGNWRFVLAGAEPLLRVNGEFDILLAHFGPNGLRASWYRDAGLVSGALVTVFHGFDLSSHLKQYGTHIYAPLFDHGDLFLPVSHFWENKLLALGCPQQKIRVHHVGIDCEHFAFRTRGCDTDKPVRLITVARLVEKKGIEYAIRALAILVSAGRNVQYHIIGDGPLLESLLELVAEEKLNNHVSFLGTKTNDEVAYELDKADIFLAPSVTSRSGDMEGIPTVIMEALAMGMPVVSTRHSGIPELVEDGISGRLVAERDVVELAAVIEVFLDDPGSWATMGRAGWKKVLEEFNIRTLNKQLLDVFENLASL